MRDSPRLDEDPVACLEEKASAGPLRLDLLPEPLTRGARIRPCSTS
ncbi:hypothetical protein [Brachybacterium sp. UNK5269]